MSNIMNTDPERKFISNGIVAYDGMNLEEYVFCSLENYKGELQDYKLDIITSQKPSDKPIPVVIFVHGGGFVQPHDKRQGYIPTFARALTNAGYAVVSPDYPVFDNSAQREAWNDTLGADRAAEALHLAYEYVKANANKFNFDSERISIMGGSAGGMACYYLLEFYDDEYKLFGNCWGAPWRYTPDVSGFPPTVSVHGTADQAVSYALEAPIHAALDKEGIPNILVTLEDAPHTPMKHFDKFIPVIIEWLNKYT